MAILIRSSELVIITITPVCGTARGAANFTMTPQCFVQHKKVCSHLKADFHLSQNCSWIVYCNFRVNEKYIYLFIYLFISVKGKR